MSNRFENPVSFFVDSTGAPYAGAKLFFYSAGTSTKLNTYSDSALTVANTNPVVLDAAGRLPNAVFLQNLQYKVILAPSTDTDPPTSPIWTQDPVYTSDYSAQAHLRSGSGNPNGSVAGTAGSATVNADTYWDFTNKVLYVCTTTGTSSTAAWTAVNASSSTPAVPQPQGRLTLTSLTPVLAADVIAATAVLYTPYVGNLVPIYNGSAFIPNTFTELTLTLVSQHVANALYDVFVFSNSGVPTLVTGPAWTTATAGSGARGTGAGTTQLSVLNGFNVNTVLMTGRNGATTYSINANLATYLGTISIDSAAGQVTCHRAFGQSRKFGVWNAYNRSRNILKAGDSTASWTYSTATIRAANGAAANSLSVLTGLPEELFNLGLLSSGAANSANAGLQNGIGVNSTTVISGYAGAGITSSSTVVSAAAKMTAHHILAPSIGLNTITALENASTATATTTWYGTEANLQLTAEWMG